MLNITDKAVSKWERDIACPDTQTIPKLAKILDISVEDLMNAKLVSVDGQQGAAYSIHTPKSIGYAIYLIAMGIVLVPRTTAGIFRFRQGSPSANPPSFNFFLPVG